MKWFRRGTRADSDQIDPAIRREVVEFLREWLPRQARSEYREMMLADPERWHRSPHFRGDLVVRHFLRGNGLDERALGVRDLGKVWRGLLWEVVMEGVEVDAQAVDVDHPARGG